MIPPSLIAHQQAAPASYLGALHERCVRRFRDAARLVGADVAPWPALDRWMEHRPTLAPLGPFWAALCARYNAEVYDPQPDLLRQDETPEDLFSRFVHWRLWPLLVQEDECLRNVLRACASLPSTLDPWDAGRALAHAMQEWRFHLDMRRTALGSFE